MSDPQTLLAASPEPTARKGTVALRRRAVLLTSGCLAAAALCGLLAVFDREATAQRGAREARLASLAADARAIALARNRPRQVSETDLPTGDLLKRVEHAMQTAGLEPKSLVSTVPQPARRVPGTDRSEASHRLILENARLEPLVRFCRTLCENHAELHVAALHLRPSADADRWNADVSVGYWLVGESR